MKQGICLGVIVSLAVILSVGPCTAKELYDNFSGTYIDESLWDQSEFVREIDTVKEQLVSKIGTFTGDARYRMRFKDPESIYAIEARITVVDTNVTTDTDDETRVFARIEGHFYNSQSSSDTAGDILAGIELVEAGSGLRVDCIIEETLSGGDETSNIMRQTLIPVGDLNYNVGYTVRLAYNESTNEFTFTGLGESITYDGPDRQRSEIETFKSLTTGFDSDDASAGGFISAMFDNVRINNEGIYYEYFNDEAIDTDKWIDLETAREISDGELRLNIQTSGEDAETTLTLNDDDTPYLEASVAIDRDSNISEGARGIAGIGGYFYNDSRGPGSDYDYNQYQGDVWAENRILLDSDGDLTASAVVRKHSDENQQGQTQILFDETFTRSIQFETDYALSIEYTESELVFECGTETLTFQISGDTYDPNNDVRELGSRVYANFSDESGYIKAAFDNVYTETGGQGSDDTDDGESKKGACFISTSLY